MQFQSQFRDASIALGSFVIIPGIMFVTKILRMDAKDHSEQLTDVRYRAVFWERANDFVRAMNDTLLEDMVKARTAEITAAAQREAQAGGYTPPADPKDAKT